eukprot:scaffold177734_cov14-Tisochrysis_lutea.AAC.1
MGVQGHQGKCHIPTRLHMGFSTRGEVFPFALVGRCSQSPQVDCPRGEHDALGAAPKATTSIQGGCYRT